MGMVVAVAVSVAVAATGTYLVLRAFAGMVVLPRKPKLVTCVGRDDDLATFRVTAATSASGIYAARIDDRRHTATVGRVVAVDERARTVTREIVADPGDHLRAGRVEWVGMVWSTPDDLELASTSVVVQSSAGACPAWLIPGVERASHWAIHVHGLRVNRDSPLRGVKAAAAAGVTSLVVTYRGDGEGPEVAKDATMLGQTEWIDVDAAVRYAIENGAETITLLGWSQGAGIALRVAEKSAHTKWISDLILVGPTTDWVEIIAFGAAAVRVPRWVSTVVVGALGWRPFARSVGLAGALDFEGLCWTSGPRLSAPTLVIHSVDDDEVPIQLSRRLAQVNSGLVTLEEFHGALHTMEWNVDRPRFEQIITARLTSTPSNPGRGIAPPAD